MSTRRRSSRKKPAARRPTRLLKKRRGGIVKRILIDTGVAAGLAGVGLLSKRYGIRKERSVVRNRRTGVFEEGPRRRIYRKR